MAEGGYSNKRRLEVKQVVPTDKTRPQFRRIARESSGESFDPPEGEKVFFAYDASQRPSTLIGVASVRKADKNVTSPVEGEFLSSYYHVISYLFVKSYFKSCGNGSQILKFVERAMLRELKRPFRLQSAEKAVPFFAKHGYVQIGDRIDTMCAGSPLFRRLYNMEKK